MRGRFKTALICYGTVAVFLLLALAIKIARLRSPSSRRNAAGVEWNVDLRAFQRAYIQKLTAEGRRTIIDIALESLRQFNATIRSCSALASGGERRRLERARRWRFDDARHMNESLGKRGNQCTRLRERFAFLSAPLSVEEAAFPLAIGVRADCESARAFFALSAVYHPQNAHCVAIEGSCSEARRRHYRLLAECIPNVAIIVSRASLKTAIETAANRSWAESMRATVERSSRRFDASRGSSKWPTIGDIIKFGGDECRQPPHAPLAERSKRRIAAAHKSRARARASAPRWRRCRPARRRRQSTDEAPRRAARRVSRFLDAARAARGRRVSRQRAARAICGASIEQRSDDKASWRMPNRFSVAHTFRQFAS